MLIEFRVLLMNTLFLCAGVYIASERVLRKRFLFEFNRSPVVSSAYKYAFLNTETGLLNECAGIMKS